MAEEKNGAASPRRPPETKAELRQWNRACHVRQVRLRYLQLAQRAQERGSSVAEEMLAEGHGSWAAFVAACPPFALNCAPVDLAELGSGVVLYFQHLQFSAAALLLLSVLQLPALVVYLLEDGLESWAPRLREGVGLGADSRATPGALGPGGGRGAFVPALYALATWLLGLLMVLQDWHRALVRGDVEGATTNPRDFAVLVEGLPKDARVDEAEIRSFFRQHAVQGRGGVEIVKVVIAWDVAELSRKQDRAEALEVALARSSSSPKASARREAMEAELAELRAALEPAGCEPQASGAAVVLFRHGADRQACLRRWHTAAARWLYSEQPPAFGLLGALLGGGGGSLPLFPLDGRPAYKVRISPAPDATDVNWRSLGSSERQRFLGRARTLLIMAVLVLFSLLLVYGLTKWQVESERFKRAGVLVRALPSCLLGILNIVLMAAAAYLGQGEHHRTRTGMAVFATFMMTSCMVANSALVLFLVHRDPKDWYRRSGLVSSVYFMLFLNFFLPPLMFLTDFEFAIKWLHRRTAAPGQIRALRTEEGESAERRARWLRSIFEPSEMDLPRHHANAQKTLLCCLLFSPLVPLASLIGFFSILLQYAVDKWMLLRYCRRPEVALNADFSRWSTEHLRFAGLLGLPLAALVFLGPSWHSPAVLDRATLAALVPFAVLSVTPTERLAPWVVPKRWWRRREAGPALDYYEAQYMWPRAAKYHKSHVLYGQLPEECNPEHLDALSGTLSAEDFGNNSHSLSLGRSRNGSSEAELLTPHLGSIQGLTTLRDAAGTLDLESNCGPRKVSGSSAAGAEEGSVPAEAAEQAPWPPAETPTVAAPNPFAAAAEEEGDDLERPAEEFGERTLPLSAPSRSRILSAGLRPPTTAAQTLPPPSSAASQPLERSTDESRRRCRSV